MYSKIDRNLSECFCENNNNISEKSYKVVMNTTSERVEKVKHRKNSRNGKTKQNNSCNDPSLEIRKEEVLAIRNRFPTKIPVVVQRFYKENHLPQLDKSKFLVPQDITMSQFQTIIRNRMRMSQNQALYLLVNERSMLSLSLTLGQVYTEHAGANGFLYVTYASQEVFGGPNKIVITNSIFQMKKENLLHENSIDLNDRVCFRDDNRLAANSRDRENDVFKGE